MDLMPALPYSPTSCFGQSYVTMREKAYQERKASTKRHMSRLLVHTPSDEALSLSDYMKPEFDFVFNSWADSHCYTKLCMYYNWPRTISRALWNK